MKIHAHSFHKQVKILSLVSQPVVVFFICYLMSNSQVWKYSYGDYRPSQLPEVLYYKLKKQEAHARFNHCCTYTHAPSRDRGLNWTGRGQESERPRTHPKQRGGDGRWTTCEVGFQTSISCPGVPWGFIDKPKPKKNLVKTSKQ